MTRTNELASGRVRSVWFDAGGGAILMIEVADPDEPPVPKGSFELACFRARTKKELAARRARLEKRRVRIEGETEYTFYFRDPEGRRLGFSCYRWKA